MITKSIRLTKEEAAKVRDYVERTGEVEASVLKRAALRGLEELRQEQGILAYLRGASSSEAAEIAGMGRAEFLNLLFDRGVTLDDDVSMFYDGLLHLADEFADKGLREAVERVAKEFGDK